MSTFSFRSPEWVDALPSTNSALLERIHTTSEWADGWVLAAREQTAGRGRHARTWTSFARGNLTFSFLLTTQAVSEQLASLPMAVALGVVDALEGWGVAASVKWPNDVWAGGRKICGILTEQKSLPEAGVALVVGVGLNLGMTPEEAAAIDRPATSLLMETGRSIEPEHALVDVLKAVAPRIRAWQAAGFSALAGDWNAASLFMGERITILDGGTERTGTLSGFGPSGELLMEQDDGTVHAVWAGDVVHLPFHH